DELAAQRAGGTFGYVGLAVVGGEHPQLLAGLGWREAAAFGVKPARETGGLIVRVEPCAEPLEHPLVTGATGVAGGAEVAREAGACRPDARSDFEVLAEGEVRQLVEDNELELLPLV